jgi:two-component system CheB/CheR fusion protein
VANPLANPPADQGANQTIGPDFPIVAVGASAGGLETLTDLLKRLPTNTGMSFVIIQHLSPSHVSLLAELLSRATKMPVHHADHGQRISPNHVYVIPPDVTMTISGFALSLRQRDGPATVVDSFLRSLAASQKNRAVAVILSGTGSDGALGVQAIAEEGGVVFVQDPSSAKFDGMPRAAIATGCVDCILPLAEIATELVRIAHEPRIILPSQTDARVKSFGSEREFAAIFDLLRTVAGIDFALYRQTTVRRRIMRRIGLLRLSSLLEYVQHLRVNLDEVHALAQDILIRVTRFFRDYEVFDVLCTKVFPNLIRNARPNIAVRVWVSGCSTGEEPYSLAMCFTEVAEQMQSRSTLQIFATDINGAAIEKARRGVYIENITADVSPERLARFFVKTGKNFCVTRALRNMCNFSRHDMLEDPAFSRMNLVSCRNVLIYLDSMQENALSLFHFALNPGGLLLLGKSETASSASELFAPVDPAANLWVRQDRANAPPRLPLRQRRADVPSPYPQPRPRQPDVVDLRNEAERVVAEKYGPPRAVINRGLEILSYGGNISLCLRLASISHNPNILDAVHGDLLEHLTRAIEKAKETDRPVRVEPVKLATSHPPQRIALEVSPLGTERAYFLILFHQDTEAPELSLEAQGAATDGDPKKLQKRIDQLQNEVSSSRARLESTITQQDAAHEEVISGNEELQSLNEELASSKEELEAGNEELTTINQELQTRNGELDIARVFAEATIDTVRGPLLVLGPDLRVVRANQAFCRTFRTSSEEVEHRFVYELDGGSWSVASLRRLLENMLVQNSVLEDVEISYTGRLGGPRVLLLNARRFEHEERILLGIEDVTESRRIQEEQRQSQKMEAIGHLAAGVAHDFNNLLTGMMGNASLLLDSLPKDASERVMAQKVVEAGERAADLTRQLLAYAGQGRYYVEQVDLSDVALQTSRLIHASIPANVQLRLDLEKDLPKLLADPSQVQQVVMNILINAAEAIGSGNGLVLVRTGRQTVGHEQLVDLYQQATLAPGQYVFLEVKDNGVGMNEETKRQIFDPFFTTKFTGRGLGLSAVLGIINQCKGTIQIHSVPGRGSTFRVMFAVAEGSQARTAAHDEDPKLAGSGTVLVVDDEELIRTYNKLTLEQHGYTVLLAENGQRGVELFWERSEEIRLVLLDMAMPVMNGLEALECIQAIRPDVPVIICSGLGEAAVERQFEGKRIAAFLPKPYTVAQFLRTIQKHMPSEDLPEPNDHK